MKKSQNMQTFQLGKFLNSTLAGYKRYAQQKNIEFTPVTDFVFDITLAGNKAKIRSLLSNALKNTFDHSGATSVVFSIRQLLASQTTTLIEFCLETNGSVSVAPEKFSYFRSLVASRAEIEGLKGKSEFIISPNNGSIFKFIIGFTLTPTGNDLPNSDFSLLEGRKILVVDDNENNRVALLDFLEGEGAQCTAESSGTKAIALLEKNNLYDLIILDILMPQMDGFETAAYIRKQLKNNTPIIAIPARNKIWMPLRCKEVGINNFINKPFAANRLLSLINSTLPPVVVDDPVALMKIA